MNLLHEEKKGILLLILFWTTTLLSKIVLPFTLGMMGVEANLTIHLKIFLGQLFAYLLPLLIFTLVNRTQSRVAFKTESLFNLSQYNQEVKPKGFVIVMEMLIFYLFVHFLLDSLINLYIFFTSDYSVIITNSNPPFNSFIILVFIFAIMPAFIEETIYRGLYFDTYKNNKVLLFVIPTIVFALSHASVISIITSMLLGLFLMFIMSKTNNLRLVIFLHFFYNFLSLIFSNYVTTPLSPNTLVDQLSQKSVILGLSFVNLGISFLLLLLLLFLISIYNNNVDVSRKKVVFNISTPKTNLLYGVLLCLSSILLIFINIFIFR